MNGVAEAGLMTIVHPAASAGAPLRVIIAAGKFHGVMRPQTPTGCLIVRMRRSPMVLGMVWPYARLPSSANQSTNQDE